MTTPVAPNQYHYNYIDDNGTAELSDIKKADDELDAGIRSVAAAIGNRALLPTPGQDLVTAIGSMSTYLNDEATARVVTDGLLSSLVTTNKSNLVAAINESITTRATGDAALSTRLDTAHTSGGDHKAGVIGTANLQDASITAPKLAPEAVTGPVIAPTALTPGNLVFDPINRDSARRPRNNWDGRRRWLNDAALALVVDPSNPFGSNTLRHLGTGNAQAGKTIWCDEAHVKPGDTLTATLLANASSGSIAFSLRSFSANGTALGPSPDSTGTVAMSGTAQYFTVKHTVVSGAAYIVLFTTRVTGTADIDWLFAQANKGDYVAKYAMPEGAEATAATQTQVNLIEDPFNEYPGLLGTDWGAKRRWFGTAGTSIVLGDSGNPFGGNTWRVPSPVNQVGKRIHFAERAIQAGDVITGAAILFGTAADGWQARINFYDQTSTLIASTPTAFSSTVLLGTGSPAFVSVTSNPAPSTATHALLYLERQSGSTQLDIYAMWANRGQHCGALPGPSSTPTYALRNAVEMAGNAARIGDAYLQSWKGALAMIAQNLPANSQAIPLCLGDSWFQRLSIVRPLRNRLKALYGDAGQGWVDLSNGWGQTGNYQDGWALTRAGTWTDIDVDSGGSVLVGVDGGVAKSTDTMTPASITLNSNGLLVDTFVVHYLQQVNGGDFRYKVDAGAWTTITTAAAVLGYATVSIPTGSQAAHTLTIEVTNASVAEVALLGVDLQRANAGIRLHKMGNGGTTAFRLASIDPALFAAGLQALNPNVVLLLLGTNDRSQDYPPLAYATNVGIIVDRIQAALPYCGVVLISPSEQGDAAAYPSALYDQALRQLAHTKRCAFFSGYTHMSPYSANKALHLATPDTGAADAVTGDVPDGGRHLTVLGGQLLASGLVKMLMAE